LLRVSEKFRSRRESRRSYMKRLVVANRCLLVLGLVLALSLPGMTACAQSSPLPGGGSGDVETMRRDFKRLVAEREQRGEDTTQARELYNHADEALRSGDKKEYARRLTAAMASLRPSEGMVAGDGSAGAAPVTPPPAEVRPAPADAANATGNVAPVSVAMLKFQACDAVLAQTEGMLAGEATPGKPPFPAKGGVSPKPRFPDVPPDGTPAVGPAYDPSTLRDQIGRSRALLRDGMGLLCGGSLAALPGVSGQTGACEDSPFGFHPARVEGVADPYAYAKDMGVMFDRSICLPWQQLQPDLNRAEYVWSQPQKGSKGLSCDERMRQVPWGMCMLAQITPGRPTWQTAAAYLRPRSYEPLDGSKYVAFVRAAVERYDGDGVDDMPGLVSPIKYWEVENEPWNPDVEGYCEGYPELMRLTYRAIKEADPTAKVVWAGAHGFPDEVLANFRQNDEPAIRRMGRGFFDIFDFHWYGNAKGDYRRMGPTYDAIKQSLNACGYRDCPIWVCEMGTYSGRLTDKKSRQVKQASYQSEELQAADLLKRYVYSLSIGIRKIFPAYGLIEGFGDTNGYFDHTGVVYDGKGEDDRGYGVKKLAYYTYKLMTEKLEGSDWSNIVTVNTHVPNVYAYIFRKQTGRGEVIVAWWDWFDETQKVGGASRLVTLPCDAGRATITQSVTDAAGRRTSSSVVPRDGKVEVRLGEDPVFVEFN